MTKRMFQRLQIVTFWEIYVQDCCRHPRLPNPLDPVVHLKNYSLYR